MSRDEAGSVLPLVIGLMLICFSVTGLAVDGTRVFIARRSLQSAADAASVGGAAEIDRGAYYRSGGAIVRLQSHAAEATAARLFSERGLDASVVFEAGRRGIDIVVRSQVPTTFLKMIGIDSIPVEVSAVARPFPQDVPIGR